MAQIALPRQHVTQTPSAPIGSPLYQRRHQSNTGPVGLVPNPGSTFPTHDPNSAPFELPSTPHAGPMSLQAYPAGRRDSAPGLRQKSVMALPDFSFHPSAAASTGTSPPHSPISTPSRPIGIHRRGGSEFIGGDGRAGGTTLSASPTKRDAILSPPPISLYSGSPAGRRGHAHRRSGALSSHDLSSITSPPTPARSESAPVTPAEGQLLRFGHTVNKSVSQPSLRDATTFSDDASITLRPPSRARVGFSDTVEYIRPLSTISSETETSMSTANGHSATNSLSSVLSAGTSSPQPARTGHSRLNTIGGNEPRPSTAGAVLYKHQSINFEGCDFNRKRPSSAISPVTTAGPASPTLAAKRRSFFRLESRRNDSCVHALASTSDSALSVSLDLPLPSPLDLGNEGLMLSEKTKIRKSGRAPRKVKTWASSIIPRKAKYNKKTKTRALTPPTGYGPDANDTDTSEDLDLDAMFDVDKTVTIVSPTAEKAPASKDPADFSIWQPRQLARVNSDSKSPVIDLDAALGPFNTPHGASPRPTQRGFGAHRRAMHSAGGLLQTHRRTESAPELLPFELRNSTVAQTSTMADVFEEEEPEEDTAKSAESPTFDEGEEDEELNILVVETDGDSSNSAMNWNFNDALATKRNETTQPPFLPELCSPFSAPKQLASAHASPDPVEVVEDHEEPRASSLTHTSESTISSLIVHNETKEPPPSLNFSLPLPKQNLMTPDTITSSFSSPDFRSSQLSLDTSRLDTAASSMTDYQAMPSPHFGEPGPEIRVSVDDVPSLTSSRSTMTSAMQNQFSLASHRRIGDRSASLCSVPSDSESRRRKRSSIASLSRLINSSSCGERSKLSIETRPQSECLEISHRDSKTKHKRLSRLMQFWKPKDSWRTGSNS